MSELTGKFAYRRTVFMSTHDAAINATVQEGERHGVKQYRSHGNVNANRRSLGRTMRLIAKHRDGKCGCNLQYEQKCKAVKDLKESYATYAIDAG